MYYSNEAEKIPLLFFDDKINQKIKVKLPP